MNSSLVNIPNAISSIRLFLAWPLAHSIINDHLKLAVIIGTVAVISDFADGYASRVFKQSSPIGKVIDPIVDCIMVISAMIALSIKKLIPLWYVILIALRYFFVSIMLYRYKQQSKQNPQSVLSGKISMCVIAAVIVTSVFKSWVPIWNQVFILMSTNLLIISAYEYYSAYIKHNKLVT